MTGQARKRVFKRQGWSSLKRVGTKWRRPVGRQSKLREKWKNKGKWPHPGYRRPESGKHPSGLYEIMVHNVNDLSKVNPKINCARISGTVGMRKKIGIVAEAKKLGIKVLNPATREVKK